MSPPVSLLRPLRLQSLYPSEYPVGDPTGVDWLWYHPGRHKANGFYRNEMAECLRCDVQQKPLKGRALMENCWNCGKFMKRPSVWTPRNY